MTKYCPMCYKLYQHADQSFYKDRQNADGYKTKCKQCIKDNRTEPIQPACPLIRNKGGCYGQKQYLQDAIDNTGY